jgi:hypothetical protein
MLQRRILYIVKYIDAKLRQSLLSASCLVDLFQMRATMKTKAITNCLSAVVLASLLGVITLPVLISPSEAQYLAKPRPAPGPLVGAGLPVLVIAGGAYWVVRRLRRKRS